jgi:hypothetical protein
VFRDEQAYSVCKSCNAEVAIPLKLDVEMLKSMAPAPRRVPLYIKK